MIDEIKALTKGLRNDITKKSKKSIFDRLVNIWAKIAKQGPSLIKEFLTEGRKICR